MGLQRKHMFSWLFVASTLQVSSLHLAQAAYLYTAFVNVSYVDPENTTVWQRRESGLYGQDSPKASVSGDVVLPEPIHGCETNTFYDAPSSSRGWIALIQRGHGCTFSEKINIAASNGAIAVAIFNEADTGNSVIQMAHPGTFDTVAIMIGNSWGMEIVGLVKSGIPVIMSISVGKPHGPWMSQYSLILVSVSFFVVTAATVGYFIFHSARRLYRARAMIRRQKQLKAEAKKAISQLQVRTLNQGDQETGPEADTCAVCIEAYKPGDVVSILTCSHFFHKVCIEPWLLEHRTCPMCKCDILKSLGVEPETEEAGSQVNSPQVAVVPDLNFYPTLPPMTEEDSRSEAASSGYASVQGSEDNVQQLAQTPIYETVADQNAQNADVPVVRVDVQPHYDNLGFEGDSQVPRQTRT
ncbi:E3 ubiquitin-protein ligase RNF128-like isoform X1 [Megalops cyprinoides]|uniref:E3 ubiquitin-protein ligase RNF128-like isoform X1 n=1 Tax=Megalops cyprinoides TaxID=118141 RepID=UPI001864AFD6|nr:E3 ubiquitin-protein ligase RNF128-like isoform X1 [Megalops cyprinoides]